MLFLSGYPPGSGVALLRGALSSRYCATRFAHKVPSWSLPARSGVDLLVGLGDGTLVRSDPSSPDSGRIGSRVGISGSRYERVRLSRKTLVHEVFRESSGITLRHVFGRD